MKKILQTVLIFVILAGNCYPQVNNKQLWDDWKMKPIHIVSRWAKDVDPTNVLQEYPRPQMVRINWESLNGIWEYTITKKRFR